MNEAARDLPAGPMPVKFSEQAVAKFLSKIDPNGPLPDQSNPHYQGLDRCHDWAAGMYRTGYGQVYLDRKPILAHRAAWIISGKAIPIGKMVLHRCDNKKCVNPNHLWIGTHQDNIDDMMNKGRGARGDKSGPRLHPERMKRGDENGSRIYPERLKRGIDNHQAKLTEENVLEIRARYIPWKVSCSMLGKQFGVTPSIINHIVRRKIWKHVA